MKDFPDFWPHLCTVDLGNLKGGLQIKQQEVAGYPCLNFSKTGNDITEMMDLWINRFKSDLCKNGKKC